jgi:hypothetical protein
MLERTLEAFEGAYIYRGKIIDHPDDHQISDPRNQGGHGYRRSGRACPGTSHC